MQALRLARTVARPALAGSRGIAVTANASATASTTPRAASIIPLSNVEAQWENLSSEDQLAVHQQLAELQKKDWRTLSIDEKKAGDTMKIILAVAGAAAVAGAISAAVKSFAPPPPKTINKEWEQASNERAIEQKMDPISGIASEGYKGPTFVQTK